MFGDAVDPDGVSGLGTRQIVGGSSGPLGEPNTTPFSERTTGEATPGQTPFAPETTAREQSQSTTTSTNPNLTRDEPGVNPAIEGEAPTSRIGPDDIGKPQTEDLDGTRGNPFTGETEGDFAGHQQDAPADTPVDELSGPQPEPVPDQLTARTTSVKPSGSADPDPDLGGGGSSLFDDAKSAFSDVSFEDVLAGGEMLGSIAGLVMIGDSVFHLFDPPSKPKPPTAQNMIEPLQQTTSKYSSGLVSTDSAQDRSGSGMF